MESLFEMVESVENVVRIQEDLEKTKVIALDIETTGLSFKDDTILLIQFRINGNTYLIDPKNLPEKVVVYILEMFKLSEKTLLGHNIKFDLKFIYEKYGILYKKAHCTMIAEFLITEAKQKFMSLQDVVFEYTGVILDKKIRKQFIGATELTQEMLIYGASDVEHIDKVRILQNGIIETKNLGTVFQLEMDLLPVVVVMESNGVAIDDEKWMILYETAVVNSAKLRKQVAEMICDDFFTSREHTGYFETAKDVLDYYFITYKKTKKEAKRLEEILIEDEEGVRKEFLEQFNVGSPKQLKKSLQIMGMGVESTEEKVLKSLKNDFPIAALILKFRFYYKRATTYGVDFLSHLRDDGRIYAEFNQIGTDTGRFSSRKPNLQNIIGGKEYRECFIAPKGKKLITADYSQQEFRLAGELSGDERIIEAYLAGKDMHTATASVLFHKELEDVTSEERDKGKTVNFAVLYGSSAFGLARTMSIPELEAEAHLERFRTGFPRLSAFQQAVNRTVWDRRYSVTPIGRRKGFDHNTPTRKDKKYYQFKGALEREGFNHIIQGGSADMVKYALLLMFEANTWADKFKVIMTVHDEIVVEVDEAIAEEAKVFIIEKMNMAGEMFMSQIPSAVDATIADYWSK